MATKLTDPTHSDGEAGDPSKCPLCQEAVSPGGLNVHYLTSCTKYDKIDTFSMDEPKPKPKPSHHAADPSAITSATRTTPTTSTAMAEPAKPAVLGGSGSSRTPSVSSRELSNVMFMWQPMTDMAYPSVTLLASFQRGSVELKRDSEGGHYASSYVDIAKGTYQGQLVLGTMGQMYEVEEFTVSKDEEVVILQWNLATVNAELGYDMQTNPSYGTGSASATRHRAYGYEDSVGASVSPSYKKSNSASSKAESTGHYFSSDTGRGAGTASSSFSATSATRASASGLSDAAKKRLQIPHEYYATDAGVLSNYHDEYSPKLDLAEPLDQRREEDKSLREQLELVTKERDSLQNNQQRLEAVWMRRIQRLEEQLEEVGKRDTTGHGVGHSQGSRGNQVGSRSSELVELKDRNAALQEQVLEYERTIKAQAKTFTGSAIDARQMLNYSKKQQVEQAEQIEDMKRKMEDVLKMHDEYIKVSHSNIDLASHLEDYQAQTKVLMKELDDKNEEIARLKEEAQGSHNEDRLQLEMETMRQKYEGWKDEVERLLPLEEEAKRLREENVELGQQLAQMVEVGEKQKMTDRHEDGQDVLMDQLTALREVRMQNEEELLRLREERASILTENATLREGNQVQNYMTLQKKFQEVSNDARLFQELNHELSQKLQIATDGSKLKPIQDKMDRYKKERDTARSELEALREEVATLEQLCVVKTEELASAKEELNSLREKISKKKASNEERHRNREKMKEMEDQLREQHHRYQSREKMKEIEDQLREQHHRHQSREKMKEMEDQLREQHHHQPRPHHHHRHHHHHHHHQQQHASTAADPAAEFDAENDDETGRRDGLGVENSPSPNRECRHTSPDQFSLTSEVRHKDITSPTPSMEDSLSLSPLPGATPTTAPVASTSRSKARSTELSHGGTSRTESFARSGLQSGLQSGPVEVKTKDGAVLKTIQKPSTPLNPKFKPRVVIKRSEGYEEGTLMYIGKVNDKDIAGVYFDIRQKRTTGTSGIGACDGTYKDGKRYFKCPNGHGAYVSLSKVYIEMESAMV